MPHWRLYALAASRPERPPSRRPGWTLSAADLAWLRPRMQGEITLPSDPAYAAARTGFNPRYDPHPAAILAPSDDRDLRACLKLARRSRIPIAIRGGGHSFNGRSNTEGLVIDMRCYDRLVIEGTMVTVGAGARQGALRTALEAANLHIPLGDSAEVGIGGFMQGGGYGHSSRLFGMNCDHVTGLRAMLADGTIVQATADTNADLFWAIRGGAGGGFGVLLDITYRTHRSPDLATDSMSWRVRTGPERAIAARILDTIQRDYTGPHAPGTALMAMLVQGHGKHPGPYLVVDAMHRGTDKGLAAALGKLRAIAPGDAGFDSAWGALTGPKPAVAVAGRCIARPLGEANWRALLDLMQEGRPQQAVMTIHAHGDAIDAVPREANAFIHRTPSCLLALNVFWDEPGEEAPALAFQKRWSSAVAPFWNGRVYVNFPSDELADYRDAYWGEAFPMLLAVRRKYDPASLFAAKHDVSPDPDRRELPALWPPRVADALERPIEA